ncbi:MAG TPA: hypothetical protein QGF50_04645 [Roseibacillus sp.]|nr:hypothetical protein [Roseibacillus sp.]
MSQHGIGLWWPRGLHDEFVHAGRQDGVSWAALPEIPVEPARPE